MGWNLFSGKTRNGPCRPSERAPRHTWSLVLEDLEERRLPSQAFQPILTIAAASGPTSNIVASPDGDLWIGVTPSQTAAEIKRIGVDGSITSFPVPESVSAPGFVFTSLTNGPDGNLWFEASGSDATGKILEIFVGDVTPTGQVTELPPIRVHNNDLYSSTGLVSGPGGDLWFGYTDLGDNVSTGVRHPHQSFVVGLTTTGTVTVFPIPTFRLKSPTLGSMAAGPDGNLWLTENSGRHSVLVRMTSSGAFTRFSTGSMKFASVGAGLAGSLIAYGQNSRGQNEVYGVSTSGRLARYKIPATTARAFQNYLGSADGALWFSNGVLSPLKLGQIAGNGAARSYTLTGEVPSVVLKSIAAGAGGSPSMLGLAADGSTTLYRITPSSLIPDAGASKVRARG